MASLCPLGALGSAGCTGILIGFSALALDAVRVEGVRVWWGENKGPSSAPQFLYTLSLGPGKLGFPLLTTSIPPPLILRCDKAALEPRYTP